MPEARRRARRNGDGEYVPLANQDQALWDWQMIEEAEAAHPSRKAQISSFKQPTGGKEGKRRRLLGVKE